MSTLLDAINDSKPYVFVQRFYFILQNYFFVQPSTDDIPAIRRLIKRGININDKFEDGKTAIHMALLKGDEYFNFNCLPMSGLRE